MSQTLEKEENPYIITGVPGLDKLFEHGIPKGSTVIIAGGTGSGRTHPSRRGSGRANPGRAAYRWLDRFLLFSQRSLYHLASEGAIIIFL